MSPNIGTKVLPTVNLTDKSVKQTIKSERDTVTLGNLVCINSDCDELGERRTRRKWHWDSSLAIRGVRGRGPLSLSGLGCIPRGSELGGERH